MTDKAAFNAEEWDKLLEAPALAALRVIAADRGGTIRESLSLGRAYAEARGSGEDALLTEIVSSAPRVDPQGLKDPAARGPAARRRFAACETAALEPVAEIEGLVEVLELRLAEEVRVHAVEGLGVAVVGALDGGAALG
jgi:hypothetical protein